MNVSEANAVNVLARALAVETPDSIRPTIEQQQSAIDVLLTGAYRKLSAGIRPGEAHLPPSSGGGS